MMKVKHNKLKIRFDEPNDGWVATIYTYTTSDYYRIYELDNTYHGDYDDDYWKQ